MDLVVDANILIAALIKDGVTAHLLFSEKFHLFAPEFTLTEVEKYRSEILTKTHRTSEEFYQMLDILKQRLILIPLEDLLRFVQEAEKITPDSDDMAYFAAALKLKCAIWSNDKALKEKQKKVPIYHTQDLLKV